MSSADLIYIKSVLRSVLTSFPGNITVSQMLQDYADLEGEPLPYQKLGFKNVFKLLETLSDVLKVSLLDIFILCKLKICLWKINSTG